jgi:hypothetical protein
MLRGILSATAVSWWGDRIPITTSLGGTAAIEGDTAESMVARVEAALAASLREGGNRATTI